MLSSNTDPILGLEEALALVEQIIKDFKIQRKKIIRLSRTSKLETKVKVFTSALEAIEDSLQQFGSSDYVIHLKNSLVAIFQEEISKLTRLSEAPKPNTGVNLSASILEAIESSLQQLNKSLEELEEELEEKKRKLAQEALEKAKAKRRERLRQIMQGKTS